MKKRFLSMFLALALCLGLCAAPAFAADSDFYIVDGVLLVYKGSGGAVVIPDGVTAIGGFAFSDCTGTMSVTIPDSVTNIGGYVFAICPKLTDITVSPGNPSYASKDGVLFSKDMTILYDYPEGKQGGSYTIPDGVTVIGNLAFYECTGLTSVTIPNSVTEIWAEAFQGCTGLTSVTIPTSVTEIGDAAFDQCTSLTDVYYGGTEAQWKAIDVYNEDHGNGGGNDCLLNATIHYNSAAPAQPSQPSAPTTPAAPSASTAVKPAAGVSVALNDGSGQFAYTVKSGDNLKKIAAYYYGDANVYKLIYELNKDKIKNVNVIYAGQTIILPSYAAVAQGVASTAPAAPAVPSVKPAAGVSVALNDGSGEFAYTVKSGDNLKKIAAYYYGDANVYKLIYERNKDTIKNVNMIYAGQTIVLPSYAAVAKGVAKI